MESEANSYQPGGDHYKKAKIQHWDAIQGWMTPEQYVGYLLGSASKYLARYNDKDGPGGVKKSVHYLQKLQEFLKSLEPPVVPEVLAEKDLNEAFKKVWGGPVECAPQHEPGYVPVPRSSEYYVYEGGFIDKELYTCNQCKTKFETPLQADPAHYHYHQPNAEPSAEATSRYVNQD